MIDFGMADYCRPGQWLGERAGTPLYVAPEVLRQHYSTQADMWSAGAYVEGCRGSAGGGGGVAGGAGGAGGRRWRPATRHAMPCIHQCMHPVLACGISGGGGTAQS